MKKCSRLTSCRWSAAVCSTLQRRVNPRSKQPEETLVTLTLSFKNLNKGTPATNLRILVIFEIISLFMLISILCPFLSFSHLYHKTGKAFQFWASCPICDLLVSFISKLKKILVKFLSFKSTIFSR